MRRISWIVNAFHSLEISPVYKLHTMNRSGYKSSRHRIATWNGAISDIISHRNNSFFLDFLLP